KRMTAIFSFRLLRLTLLRTIGIAGNKDRPWQFCRDLRNARDVFSCVPQTAGAKNEVLLFSRGETLSVAAIGNHPALIDFAVMTLKRVEHRVAWRNHELRSAQTADDFSLVTLPFGRRRITAHRFPPREDARMGRNQHWTGPGQRRVSVAVQMNHIGPQPVFEM